MPWVPGLGPYRRLVTTKAAAESLVCEFTQEIEAGNEEAHLTAIPVKDARLPDEVFIFQAAGVNAGKFLIATIDKLLLHSPFQDAEQAVIAGIAAGYGLSAPTPT